MLIDFKVEGKNVVVLGGGSEAYRKTQDFLMENAKIRVVSKSFSPGLSRLGQQGKISLQKKEVADAESFIAELDPKPAILVALTNNHELNTQLIKFAKDAGCIVYAPDNPAMTDLILPAIAKVGDVKIAVSTAGKSPAMASILRQRIEELITPQDLNQIKLQSDLRQMLKEKVPDQKTRKEILYKVLNDLEVQELLKQDKIDLARTKALQIAQSLN